MCAAIHFHHSFYQPNAVLAKNAFVRNNQRCLTLHDASMVTVADNVAYITTGHCYFLEDAAEELNVLDHNLAVNALSTDDAARIIPTDNNAACFWLTNPNNTFTNNAAVGCEAAYWMAFPPSPMGQSATIRATDTWLRQRQQPLLRFDGNVAHSCEDGLLVDRFVDVDGNEVCALCVCLFMAASARGVPCSACTFAPKHMPTRVRCTCGGASAVARWCRRVGRTVPRTLLASPFWRTLITYLRTRTTVLVAGSGAPTPSCATLCLSRTTRARLPQVSAVGARTPPPVLCMRRDGCQ